MAVREPRQRLVLVETILWRTAVSDRRYKLFTATDLMLFKNPLNDIPPRADFISLKPLEIVLVEFVRPTFFYISKRHCIVNLVFLAGRGLKELHDLWDDSGRVQVDQHLREFAVDFAITRRQGFANLSQNRLFLFIFVRFQPHGDQGVGAEQGNASGGIEFSPFDISKRFERYRLITCGTVASQGQ